MNVPACIGGDPRQPDHTGAPDDPNRGASPVRCRTIPVRRRVPSARGHIFWAALGLFATLGVAAAQTPSIKTDDIAPAASPTQPAESAAPAANDKPANDPAPEPPPANESWAEPITLTAVLDADLAPVTEDTGAASPGLLSNQRWLILLLLLVAVLLWRRARGTEDEEQRRRRTRLAGVLALAAIILGGVILAQSTTGSTRTRVRVGNCQLEGEFGVRAVFDHARTRDYLVDELEPGLYIDSPSGRLVMKEKDIRLVRGDKPGTITFRFRRGQSGRTVFYERSKGNIRKTKDIQKFIAEIGNDLPTMRAPSGLSETNPRIAERLQGEVHYRPDDPAANGCTLRSKWLTVVWRHAAEPERSTLEPMVPLKSRIDPRKWRSRVRVSPEIIDETTGFPGQVNKATHTQVVFKVKDPWKCCKIKNTPYTVIQFVRHTWQLGNGDIKQDAWNLDGPESQSARKAQGEEYDPTYTTDPKHGAGTAGADNTLVHVGPWDSNGGNAISVDDYPGLLGPDHQRFLRAGGFFRWEFITLLVCRETRGSAATYLASGKVQARTAFTIQRDYPDPAAGGEVAVKADFPNERKDPRAEFYKKCKPLAEVLDELGMTEPFNNPRPHRIRLE